MRSRRVILRSLPFGLVIVLLGSVLVWQDGVERRFGEDVNAAPEVVVSEHDVPVLDAAPVEPTPSTDAGPTSRTVAELKPTAVGQFSMVGVTWRSGVPNDATVEVRWRSAGQWQGWSQLDLDTQNAWAEGGRPGTESLWVDRADAVAVRVRSAEVAHPRDLQVATIDPGKDSAITPVAAAVSQPPIILRGSWGASKGTSCDSPIYGSTTRGAVIHHTAGSNSYTKSDSASIVRATQAYHVQGRGWCDIGYNFLVDKYGQIFEGRKGGIDRPVRAAHSGNGAVNQETMGVSLMGTFSSTEPSSAMKAATADLVAWRFSKYGLKATGTYSLGGKTLNRIAGHRNVVSTECPGAKAYAWLSASGGLRDRVAAQLAGGSGSTSHDVPTGLAVTDTSTDSLTFAWNAVEGAPEYRIRLSTSSTMSNAVERMSVGLDEKFSGLKPDTKYYAQVRTVDENGAPLSDYSAAVSATTSKASSGIQPGDYTQTGNLYVKPTTFGDGETVRVAANFPSGYFDVDLYEKSSSGVWTKIGTDASNKYGNAYFSYRVNGTKDLFALAKTGKRTGVERVAPTGVDPTSVPETGNLYEKPETFDDGETIRLAANFPSGLFDVTYYEKTTTGAWKEVGVDASNKYGNAYLNYVVRGTKDVVAVTSTGKRTEVDRLKPGTTASTNPASATTSTSTASTSSRAVSVPSSKVFTLKGHGYGHGIGMSQYGAEGAARQGKSYRTILDHYYPGTKMSSKSGTMRVLITGDTTSSVMVEGRSGLKLRMLSSGKTLSLPTTIGGKRVVRWSMDPWSSDKRKSALRYRTSSTWKSYQSTRWSGEAQFEASTIDLVMPSGPDRTYRSALRSSIPKSGATYRDTVNVLSIENYTRGVVAREVPSSWRPETLKAQSVAARTYGVRAMSSSRYYDICDTTSCQVYGGADAETSSTDNAVAATSGKILTYGGKPAFTQFSSSSGGYTSPGSQPYLKAVSDPWDDWSGNANHDWTKSVSASTIQSKYPAIGTLRSMRVTKRNGHGSMGGRVLSLELVGSKGKKTISGNDARWAFGLRSNWFTF